MVDKQYIKHGGLGVPVFNILVQNFYPAFCDFVLPKFIFREILEEKKLKVIFVMNNTLVG